MIACRPPGWLCARRGGVFVSTVMRARAHRLGLIEQRHEAAAAGGVGLGLVGAVLADQEQIHRQEPCRPWRSRP